MPAVAPIPSASETMATAVTNGAPKSVRMANLRLRISRWTCGGSSAFTAAQYSFLKAAKEPRMVPYARRPVIESDSASGSPLVRRDLQQYVGEMLARRHEERVRYARGNVDNVARPEPMAVAAFEQRADPLTRSR